MSHFTVLVTGDDIDAALAPFHEFECTGRDDQYVQNIDRLDEVLGELTGRTFPNEDEETLEEFLEGWYGYKVIGPDEVQDTSGPHKYGWSRVVDGVVVEAIRRTNPNRKWDWYVEGGRWSNMILLKDGSFTNSALVGEIDFTTQFMTFAVLHDGGWYERGEMGWFACVSNEKNDWATEYWNLLNSLSPDTRVTVVDCHI